MQQTSFPWKSPAAVEELVKVSRRRVFDVYGYQFLLCGGSADALEGLSADFAFFQANHAETPVVIEISDSEPPYASLPPLSHAVTTPRNSSYRSGPLTYIDYQGRGLGVHNRATGDFRLYSTDVNLQYEAAYLFLLSQIAEFLDRRGLHRIHALAVNIRGRAVLVLLPMGGGKSTLGVHLLRDPEVKLLSDDSPFVDRHGDIHAFPLHLGLLPGAEVEVSSEECRKVERMEFGPKVLINYASYADRVAHSAKPGIVFLGSRSLSRQCHIERASRFSALETMLANCVVGMGLFQGMEFVFQRSLGELAGKSWIAVSRLRRSLTLLKRSQVFQLSLGRDHQRNAETVLKFAERALQ